MLHTISPQDMQEMERAFLDGTRYPSILLMEHAAQAVVQAIGNCVEKGARVLFACGCGNNGGDGCAAARRCMCCTAKRRRFRRIARRLSMRCMERVSAAKSPVRRLMW